MGVSYLKLAHDRTGVPNFAQPKFEHIQESLIQTKDRTIAICTADGLSEEVLRSLIDSLRPRLVIDLRTTPRFDFGKLNRERAFDLLAAHHAEYLDIGSATSQYVDDVDSLASTICEHAVRLISRSPASSALVLLNASLDFERVGILSIQKLRDVTKEVWEVLLFGPVSFDDAERKVIFISHANPEDNQLALWLQTQLTRLGYETWADVTHLKAGEIFWDAIEQTIRTKAVRVLALISRKSMQKPGVLDEISLAISVERSRKLPGFVIPIRVDDVPHSDFRANLARKNIVDFSTSWADGLSTLTSTLARDQVVRRRQAEGLSLAGWWFETHPPKMSVVAGKEVLISNRFSLAQLPLRVFVFSGTPECSSDSLVPLVPFKGHFLSFLSDQELRRAGVQGLQLQLVVSADELFEGRVSITRTLPRAATHRLRTAMLNKQWQSFLVARGLKLFAESGLQPIPFIPNDLLAKNVASFADSSGTIRKRVLVGYSEKRSLYWHLAPVGNFSASFGSALSLKLRVLFSKDGEKEWPSIERMRTARRAFCKNWWNDRWLSLQLSFMNWLSGGNSEVVVHDGDGGRLVVQSRPQTFIADKVIREEFTKDESAGFASQDASLADESNWIDEDIDLDEESEIVEPAP